MKASEFDKKFDDGEDLSKHLDLESIKVHYPSQRVSIDFPKNILKGVDYQAKKIGVTRTSMIKMWVAQHISESQPGLQK